MHTRKRLLFLVLVGVWFMFANRPIDAAQRSGHVCEDVCGSTNACGQDCWLTQFDFDQDYPPTTCGDQGYACCGDGVCESGDDCFTCTDDCGSPVGANCGYDCLFDSQCDSGEVCNAMHECVTPAPNNGGNGDPSCTNKGNCYAPDACMSSGECALPWKDECASEQPCTSTNQCQQRLVSLTVYCNPGNNRCMNTESPGCATSSH